MGHNRDIRFIKAFGKHLKKLRLAKKMSQEDLSFRCSMPQSQIGRFERGERGPTLNTVRHLAKGLGVELKVLCDFKYKD
jgi:transcriptional regulator with XRE-family HTH domain